MEILDGYIGTIGGTGVFGGCLGCGVEEVGHCVGQGGH